MNKKFLTLGSHIREELSEIRRSIQRAKQAWSLALNEDDSLYLKGNKGAWHLCFPF